MKLPVLLGALLLIVINSTAQITTADNGITSPDGTKVQLGGSLLQTTNIDLGGSHNFHFKKNGSNIFSILNNGNVGLGSGTRLTFQNAGIGEDPIGMSWGSDSDPLHYGIHRTAGPWNSPDYQQLRLGWLTGIVLDPGTSYGRSYVDIKGNGLRVTQGNVGIGTLSPVEKLHVNGKVYSTGLKLDAGNPIFWDDPNTSIARIDNVLKLKEYTGQIDLTGVAGLNVSFTHPTNGNASFSFPSDKRFALSHRGAYILQTSSPNQSECWVKLGASAPQFDDGPGTRLYLFGGKGGHLNQYNGGDVFIDGGEKGSASAQDGNILIATQYGNVGIGTTTPHSKLEVGASPADDQSPNVSSIWDTYNTRFNNGNVSIFSSGTATTAGDSYQLNFYGRYHDGGQGKITSKAAYIKGSVVTVRANEGAPWEGRGSLVLGSSNTSYGPAGFTDVPVMYLTNGQVGIGIAAPATQLHTTGSVRFAGLTNDNAKDRVIVSDANGTLSYRDAATLGGSSSAGWAYGGNAVPASSALGTTSNYDLPIVTNNTERMRIGANGNVGIGTTKITGYKLSVDGIIRSRKVRVDQDTWADYVFDNNYQLRSIKELEQFIQEQKHLPDVPSAAEVKKEGLDLGDNQAILLKKIEELTLYIIQQQKQLEAQQKRMDMLEKKVGNK